jgi:DNA-binding transcriptional MerR regulator
MGQYSIKELEKLSGIKAHTIRIWEKRHNIIAPSRTATNIRLYSDSDLKKIINVAIANNAGVKISHIARLTTDELSKMVSEQGTAGGEMASPIDQLVVAMVGLDEPGFESTITKLTQSMGFEDVVTKVIYPFLEKIGILWQTGNITPAQEHFISNLVRQKMMVAIDGLPYPSAAAPKAVLFLQENEYHEIGLLFYCYLVKKYGIKPIYLGQSVPYVDLKEVIKTHQPEFIITSIVTTLNGDNFQAYFDTLSTDFSKQTILISGYAARQVDFSAYPKMRYFTSAASLKSLLVGQNNR